MKIRHTHTYLGHKSSNKKSIVSSRNFYQDVTALIIEDGEPGITELFIKDDNNEYLLIRLAQSFSVEKIKIKDKRK